MGLFEALPLRLMDEEELQRLRAFRQPGCLGTCVMFGFFSFFCKFALCFVIFFVSGLQLGAQSMQPYISQVIIEEGGDSGEASYRSYWDEHFKASIGASYSYGLDRRSYRSYAYAGLFWQDSFRWAAFTLEALLYNRDYGYQLELNPDESEDLTKDIEAVMAELGELALPENPSNPERDRRAEALQERLERLQGDQQDRNEQRNFQLALQNSDLVLREANVKVNLGEHLQLLAGWHVIVWGQLDFLSPVDFLLPLRLGSTGLGLTKADNRNSQLAGILYFFPISSIELQTYFFPDLGIDSAFLDNIQQEARMNSDYRQVESVQLPRGQDSYRYAARLLFYLPNMTIGFSHYRGFFQFDADENLILSQSKHGLYASSVDTDIYRITGESKLQEVRSFGLEVAVPAGAWTWKLDAVYFSLKEDLDLDVDRFNHQILGYNEKDEQFGIREEYVRWILEQNGGELAVRNNIVIATGGVDANLDKWLLNLGLAFFLFQRSDKDDKGFELYVDAEQVEQTGFGGDEFFVAPILNVAYYTDNMKRDAVGLAAGFLNTGFGIILYTSQEYFESLRLGLAFEYLVLFSNGLVDVEGYQLENPAYPAVRFIVDSKL